MNVPTLGCSSSHSPLKAFRWPATRCCTRPCFIVPGDPSFGAKQMTTGTDGHRGYWDMGSDSLLPPSLLGETNVVRGGEAGGGWPHSLPKTTPRQVQPDLRTMSCRGSRSSEALKRKVSVAWRRPLSSRWIV